MRTKTDAMQTNPVVIEYSPELLRAYMIEARRQRAEFILTSWRTLGTRLRAWLTGNEAVTSQQAPRVVSQSVPRPVSLAEAEARRAA